MRILKKWKENRRRKTAKKCLQEAAAILLNLDNVMKGLGWSSQKRQQFWRDFIRSPKRRLEIFEDFTK